MRIAPFTSFFLDGLRLFAALGVVFVHLNNTKLGPGAVALQSYGEYFVVAFFVLSGFVIAATTDPAHQDAVRYFSLRLARLWTVALPCLLLALALEKLGSVFAPAHFQEFDRGYSFLRYGLTAIFANEFWFVSAGPPMVLPVWSLAYEFWYYVLFGVAVFVKRVWLRSVGIFLICVLIGPKILALFPIWLLGVAVWWASGRRSRWMQHSFWVIGISLVLLLAVILAHPQWPGKIGSAPWFFSAAWLSNWVFGLGVAGLIFGIDACFHACREPAVGKWFVRRGAAVSFSLYLFHFPVMVFCAGLLPYDGSSPIQVAAVLGLLVFVIYLFGSLLEPLRKPCAIRLEAWVRYLLARVCPEPASVGGPPMIDALLKNDGSPGAGKSC